MPTSPVSSVNPLCSISGRARCLARFLIVFLVALLLTTAYWLLFSRAEIPFLTLDGDAADIASMAAAHEHPEKFAPDPVFGRDGSIAYYRSDLLPVLRMLKEYVGDYGTVFALLTIPMLAFQITGTFLLGTLLLKNAAAAAMLSALLLIPVSLPGGEYWGLYPQTVPRNIFSAFLPWLLALLVLLHNRPALWALPTILLALMARIHPLSGIAWIVIVSFFFLQHFPKHWKMASKLLLAAVLPAMFLFIAAEPYLAFAHRSDPAPSELTREAAEKIINMHCFPYQSPAVY
ncbi:MAG TPA: hypothetical protein PLP17_16070, partial [Oligoflexia bacterium]|nr:hypothetical protein [Oligoflexia bacterium]